MFKQIRLRLKGAIPRPQPVLPELADLASQEKDMRDVAIISSIFRGSARLGVVRLQNALAITVPQTEWGAVQCPCVTVVECGQADPGAMDPSTYDYVLVMAASGDAAEAQRLQAAISRSRRRVMLSVAWGTELTEFGEKWDAVFVSPSGRLDGPLPLFLGGRLVGYDDAHLFALLSKGEAVIYLPGFDNAVNEAFFRGAWGVIVHFSMPDKTDHPWPAFTLGEADALFRRIQAAIPAGCHSLLSVGADCRAGSPILIFAIVPPGSVRGGRDARMDI